MNKQSEIPLPEYKAFTVECVACEDKNRGVVLVVMEKSISPDYFVGTCRLCNRKYYEKVRS